MNIFDENSSSHLSFGRAYRFCLDGGEEMKVTGSLNPAKFMGRNFEVRIGS